MTNEKKKSGADKQGKKREPIRDMRKPPTALPKTEDVYRIVSPDIHEPEGQNTHE